MSATRLFLIRHGEVESRYQGAFGGRIDMDLSPQGHRQAEATARYLQPLHFNAIYCSPMKRARQTLAPLLCNGHAEAVILPDFGEVHFGDWTGLTWQEVFEKYQIHATQWLDFIEQAKVPNGECSRLFRSRIEPGLRKILQDHPNQSVAIVCHGGVIRMMLSILLKLPLPQMASFEVEYASITEVHCTPQRTVVERLNFTPWRDLP